MRIIFSRKGFDSQYGGVPSPLLPDGGLTSFPIPSRYGRPIDDLSFRGRPLVDLVNDLKGGVGTVHLDPDLEADCVPRQPGWLPTFGQVGGAQSHLANEGVGVGDVFLFFGWFRQVEQHQGRWRYVRSAPHIHSLFGWLQVGEIIPVPKAFSQDVCVRYPWLADHPHVQHGTTIGTNNTLYVATQHLTFGRRPTNTAGAGMFRRWTSSLQLTEPGRSRSRWLLPSWMSPEAGMPALSLHSKESRWETIGNRVRLQTVGKGQEFVLNMGEHRDGIAWVRSLIESHSI
ncbi:hypothetical protein PE066_19035 [Ramlibacter tataouinensis]|uniref:Nmad3 family putative nucleotide modification protein n=1 Tax=Ramlibacter tataouinensis TaxID=94132 RepID=UPI0022F3D2B1|nr:hypothetical protein [Ramlibacter tataouinensis]WBY01533.1 hypothetical protein PE066_19035 [Ramlibacter tataouinensis]